MTLERVCDRAGQHGLADARDILDEHVPFAQQRREDQLDRLTLPDDDFFDVADHAIGKGLNFVHVAGSYHLSESITANCHLTKEQPFIIMLSRT